MLSLTGNLEDKVLFQVLKSAKNKFTDLLVKLNVMNFQRFQKYHLAVIFGFFQKLMLNNNVFQYSSSSLLLLIVLYVTYDLYLKSSYMLDPVNELVNKYLSTRISILTPIAGTERHNADLNKGSVNIFNKGRPTRVSIA